MTTAAGMSLTLVLHSLTLLKHSLEIRFFFCFPPPRWYNWGEAGESVQPGIWVLSNAKITWYPPGKRFAGLV